jgi:hypothetical protein
LSSNGWIFLCLEWNSLGIRHIPMPDNSNGILISEDNLISPPPSCRKKNAKHQF